jgi:fucose permease
VSFLLEKRGGSPDVGYVSTGFFLGLTVSRFLLIPLNRFLGDRTAVLVYLTVALALEFVVWFGKGVISAAVAVSLVGFMFGPAFPIGIAVLTKLLPRSYLVGAIGTVTAM